jgi:hypothetical protein
LKVQIFIDKDRIGEANLNVIDEFMGVLGGQVTFFPEYEKYRSLVQRETFSKGGVNVDDLPFSIVSEKGSVLQAKGGVMLIDSPEFDEFSVEIAGVDLSNFHE